MFGLFFLSFDTEGTWDWPALGLENSAALPGLHKACAAGVADDPELPA